jgi:hypothetical protein
MPRSKTAKSGTMMRRGVVYPSDPLQAMAQFRQGKDPAHISLRRLLRRLERAGIDYAVMGGLAVWAHGYHRFTNDVDILVTREGWEEFRRRFVPKSYEPVASRPRRFLDKQNQVVIDFLVAGLFPGMGRPGPIAFPEPRSVRQTIQSVHYVDLATLIQLKLAARRHKDFGDVVDLIRANDLDESYRERLHPSVRPDYIECLEEKRREDEYEARM